MKDNGITFSVPKNIPCVCLEIIDNGMMEEKRWAFLLDDFTANRLLKELNSSLQTIEQRKRKNQLRRK